MTVVARSSALPRPPLPPIPAALAAMVSIQGGAALAKGLFAVAGPLGTTGLRVTLAAVLLSLVSVPALRGLRAAQWRALLPYGVVLGVMNLCYYVALSHLPLALAVTLEFVGPLGVAVLSSRRALDVLWVLLAAAGIALITPWQAGSDVSLLGVAFALAAGVCWGLYIVLGQRASKAVQGRAAVAGGMLFAAVVALPFGLFAGGAALLNPAALGVGLLVALLSSALPYSLEMAALRALPARTFGVLMSVEPAFAALIGLIFLHEQLSTWQWLAIACVITASAGSTLGARNTPAPVEV